MAASNSVLAAPPPTANILPHSQRTRLLKSSRKIEAMLGTTPLVVPVVDLPPQNSPSHAVPKLERSRSKAGKGPQPVLLRSRSVALPPLMSSTHVKSSSMDTAGNSSGPATPVSALFSPITKETNDAKEREMRRKKMAKISRTLGENIPPELVFGASHQQESKESAPKSTGKTHRRRGLSVSSTSSSNVVIDTFPDPEEGELTPTAATSPGFDSAPSQPTPLRDAPAVTPTASNFYQHHAKAQSHYTLPTSSTVHRSRSQRTIAGYYPVYHAGPFVSTSPAFDTLEPSPHLSTISLGASSAEEEYSGRPLQRNVSTASTSVPSPRNAKSLDVQRSSTFTNFQDIDANQGRDPADYVWGTRRQKSVVHVQSDADADADAGGRRKENEWSGEWNVKDMGDVVKKLRQLKGR